MSSDDLPRENNTFYVTAPRNSYSGHLIPLPLIAPYAPAPRNSLSAPVPRNSSVQIPDGVAAQKFKQPITNARSQHINAIEQRYPMDLYNLYLRCEALEGRLSMYENIDPRTPPHPPPHPPLPPPPPPPPPHPPLYPPPPPPPPPPPSPNFTFISSSVQTPGGFVQPDHSARGSIYGRSPMVENTANDNLEPDVLRKFFSIEKEENEQIHMHSDEVKKVNSDPQRSKVFRNHDTPSCSSLHPVLFCLQRPLSSPSTPVPRNSCSSSSNMSSSAVQIPNDFVQPNHSARRTIEGRSPMVENTHPISLPWQRPLSSPSAPVPRSSSLEMSHSFFYSGKLQRHDPKSCDDNVLINQRITVANNAIHHCAECKEKFTSKMVDTNQCLWYTGAVTVTFEEREKIGNKRKIDKYCRRIFHEKCYDSMLKRKKKIINDLNTRKKKKKNKSNVSTLISSESKIQMAETIRTTTTTTKMATASATEYTV